MKIVNALIELLKVKSILTLVLVITGCIGFIKGTISNELFASWVAMIITFYFKKPDSGDK